MLAMKTGSPASNDFTFNSVFVFLEDTLPALIARNRELEQAGLQHEEVL